MSLSAELRTELFATIDRQHEGLDSPEDRARLRELLVQDQAARQYYLEHLYLAAHLRWAQSQGGQSSPSQDSLSAASANANMVAGSKVFVALPSQSDAAPGISPRTLGLTVAGLLASYFVLLLCLIGWQRGHHGNAPQGLLQVDAKPHARLTNTVDCRWADARPPADGLSVSSGRQRLEQGFAELTFDSGASVVIEGPAVFEVEGGGSMKLERGKLLAQVPKRAIGFTVSTPSGKVVDRGTEFGVEADAAGRTEVHVFRGSVEWEAIGAHADPVVDAAPRRLVAGQSVSIGLNSADVVPQAADAKKFARARELPVAVPGARPGKRSDAQLMIDDGLVLWLDANDLDGNNTGSSTTGGSANSSHAPKHGSPVGLWVNKAAKLGYAPCASDAVQTQPELRPTYFASRQDDPAWLRFSGDQRTGQCLAVNWPQELKVPYTILAVAQILGNNLTNATDYVYDGMQESLRTSLGINPTGTNQNEIFCGSGGGQLLTAAWARKDWQGIHQYTVRTEEKTTTLFIDSRPHIQKAVALHPVRGLVLGQRCSNAHFLNGTIGELLVYSRPLTDSERQRVERYLMQKWSAGSRAP